MPVQDKLYEDYVSERRSLEEMAYKQGTKYDQTVLTIAGGALGLSITFLGKASEEFTVLQSVLLGVGWLLLICSIIASVEAITRSQKAVNTRIVILDMEFQGRAGEHCEIEGAALKDIRQEFEGYAQGTQRMNTLSKFSLFFGIVCMAGFSLFSGI